MEEKGKKPEGNLTGISVAMGLESAPASEAEVSGSVSPGAFYVCWAGDCRNFVPYGWTYFICSCGGHFNNV
jgi:hypothetical protein